MNLDRRTFLLSLASVGAALVRSPAWIREASEPEVAQAFVEQLDTPVTFEVSGYGTLSVPGFQEPRTRGECLDIEAGEVASLEDVERLMSTEDGARDAVAAAFLLETEQDDLDTSEVDDDELSTWLASDTARVDRAVEALKDWLLDTDLDERDYERALFGGRTDQGAALSYWQDEPELGDLLGVVIVEGDCPGSSYFAAELRMDLAEANALAASHGIPIRFVAEA